jgi:hypothetical protein
MGNVKNVIGQQPVCKSRRAVAARLAQMAAEAYELAAALLAEDNDPDEHVSFDEAVDIARTSRRILRDAARRGELTLHGRQRSRTVKRADLVAWLETRRTPVIAGTESRDIEARMARLARARRGAA